MTQYVMPDSGDQPVESDYVAYNLVNECYEKNSDNHSFLLSEMLRSETRDQTIKRNSNAHAMPCFDVSSQNDVTI